MGEMEWARKELKAERDSPVSQDTQDHGVSLEIKVMMADLAPKEAAVIREVQDRLAQAVRKERVDIQDQLDLRVTKESREITARLYATSKINAPAVMVQENALFTQLNWPLLLILLLVEMQTL